MERVLLRCPHCLEAITEEQARRAVSLKRFERKGDSLREGFREVALPGCYHEWCASAAAKRLDIEKQNAPETQRN